MYGRKVSGEGLKANMITGRRGHASDHVLHRLDGVDRRRQAAGKT